MASVLFEWGWGEVGSLNKDDYYRTPECLRNCVAEIAEVAAWLRARHGSHLPLVLLGFSFGALASITAAGAGACSPVAGVVALCSSARGGPAFAAMGLETAAMMRASGTNRLALLACEGDAVVLPGVARFLATRRGEGQRRAVLCVAEGGSHRLKEVLDEALAFALAQVRAAVAGEESGGGRAPAPELWATAAGVEPHRVHDAPPLRDAPAPEPNSPGYVVA
mmetsp:Transcript_8293/g.27576  ORF Transcript_8293/g.27576 Transcript_8293/m.27576 type:complete len:222 (+) Transcript_8293:29-694(+)